jgi:hypothetical protein
MLVSFHLDIRNMLLPTAGVAAALPAPWLQGSSSLLAQPGSPLPQAVPHARLQQMTGVPVGLAGAKVSGAIKLGTNPKALNFYDAGNGLVPPGYGNSSPNQPVNLPVIDVQTEFGFQGGNAIMTNLQTDGTITVSLNARGNWDVVPHITLTSNAFRAATGYRVVPSPGGGNTFPGLVPTSLVDDTIAISVPKVPAPYGLYEYTIQLVSAGGACCTQPAGSCGSSCGDNCGANSAG